MEDVLQYDSLPKPFRVQVIHIWGDALGNWHSQAFERRHPSNQWWTHIFNAIVREKGVFRLCDYESDPREQCSHYMMNAETNDALDLIEVSFRFVDVFVRNLNEYRLRELELIQPDQAIEELNGRFREHGIGYEFAGGEIVRVDSKFIHAEAVRPALALLYGAGKPFAGPRQEFLSAHERYRKGERKDAITWALKALESTLKGVCAARKWAFDPHKDTAAKLLQIVFDNELIPAYLQSHFAALRSILESGVPTVRNKTSGHGQGPDPTSVPDSLVRYALHMTASNIVFLIESHKALG